MKAVLLTRRSDFQVFAANYLWRKQRISGVIVERGYSFARERGRMGALDAVWRNARTILATSARRPMALVDYLRFQLRKRSYLGLQAEHNRRVLREGYEAFAPDLPVHDVEDVNSAESERLLRDMAPDVVLVFGTRIIKPRLFEGRSIPFVNMHWGWSPDYRGEGIVSALAHEGPGALGVTIHMLSAKADAGDILYQARPTVDASDNFYSIGLRLTLLGVELFERVLDDVASSRRLSGRPQDLSKGRFFGTKTMKNHPDMYHRAWRNLKQGTSAPAGGRGR